MAKFKLQTRASEIFSAPVVSADVEKGDPLKFGAGGVQIAGDGERVDAFALAAASVGSYVQCARGPLDVVGIAASGVDFDIGADVYLDASQHLDTGTTGDTAVGQVTNFDPETGGLVQVRFDPYGQTTHA